MSGSDPGKHRLKRLNGLKRLDHLLGQLTVKTNWAAYTATEAGRAERSGKRWKAETAKKFSGGCRSPAKSLHQSTEGTGAKARQKGHQKPTPTRRRLFPHRERPVSGDYYLCTTRMNPKRSPPKGSEIRPGYAHNPRRCAS